MSWTSKDPDAIEFFAWDYSKELADGDTLTAIVGVYKDGGDESLIVDAAQIAGNQVRARWAGGTDGSSYTLRVVCDTAMGERLPVTDVIHVHRPKQPV